MTEMFFEPKYFLSLGISCSVIGTFSNIVILKFFPFKGSKSTITNFFVKALAVSDFIFCSLAIPVMLILNIFGTNIPIVCNAYSLSSGFFIAYSFFLTILLGFERWLSVYKPLLLTKKKVYVLNAIAIVLALVSPASQSFKFESLPLELNSTKLNCIRKDFDKLTTTSYLLVSLQIFLFLSLFIMYAYVFHVLRQRLNLSKSQDSNERVAQLRSAFMLFGTTVIFLLTWLPYNVRIIAKQSSDITIQRLFMINNATNCFVYLLFHKKFFRNVLTAIKRFGIQNNKTKVIPVETLTNTNSTTLNTIS